MISLRILTPPSSLQVPRCGISTLRKSGSDARQIVSLLPNTLAAHSRPPQHLVDAEHAVPSLEQTGGGGCGADTRQIVSLLPNTLEAHSRPPQHFVDAEHTVPSMEQTGGGGCGADTRQIVSLLPNTLAAQIKLPQHNFDPEHCTPWPTHVEDLSREASFGTFAETFVSAKVFFFETQRYTLEVLEGDCFVRNQNDLHWRVDPHFFLAKFASIATHFIFFSTPQFPQSSLGMLARKELERFGERLLENIWELPTGFWKSGSTTRLDICSLGTAARHMLLSSPRKARSNT
jgi:hypothetical protein